MSADGMKVEIDLGQLGFSYGPDGESEQGPGITNLVIQAAADRLLRQHPDMPKALGSLVDRIAEERILEEIEKVFAEPIQRRKIWGEKDGEPTSVREIIREKVEEYLQKPAGARDSFNAGNNKTPANLGELIQREVADVMKRELQSTVAEARAKITADLRTQTAEAITKVLAK